MAKTNNDLSEKQKALDLVMSQIDRNFGKGTIMRLGDATRMKVETISTGALTLDLALGGGIPKGRVVEIYGPESSGKTTVALHSIAEVQKAGGIAAFVDAEHALDPIYAQNLGVDIDNLLVSQPDTGEAGLEIVDQLIRSNAIDLVVVDSVAALTPRAEIEGEMGDTHVGLQARLMSQALRKITGNIGRTGCSVIFLNQLRQKIGISYGNPEVTTGGNALKFYASVRMDIRRVQTLKKGTEEYGIRAKVKVAKNKVAPPFRIAEFDVIFGEGISTLGCLLDLAEEHGIVTRRGAWYSYEGDNIAQGRDNTVLYMKENSAFVEDIEQKVRKVLKLDEENGREAAMSEADPSMDATEDFKLEVEVEAEPAAKNGSKRSSTRRKSKTTSAATNASASRTSDSGDADIADITEE
ncbi:MAG: recombinase RecA [Leptolyngbyaceae bacterium]|nr:recombinase RecA [Leptolyngbyaceae bacterium]